MSRLILSAFVLLLVDVGSTSWGRESNRISVLEQSCDQAESRSIRVINENGECRAEWVCDGQTFRVFCSSGTCRCYRQDDTQVYQTITFPACDSSQLDDCFVK